MPRFSQAAVHNRLLQALPADASLQPVRLTSTTEGTCERIRVRERILAAAYDLFSRRGIAATGVDAITAQAGVAKMSLYRHFRSKDDLILAFLERRKELWRSQWLEAEIARRAQGNCSTHPFSWK